MGGRMSGIGWGIVRNIVSNLLYNVKMTSSIYIYGTPPPKPTVSYPFLCRDVFTLFEAGYIYIYGHISIDIHKIRNSKYLKTPKKFGRARSFKTPLVAKQGVLKLLAPKIED